MPCRRGHTPIYLFPRLVKTLLSLLFTPITGAFLLAILDSAQSVAAQAASAPPEVVLGDKVYAFVEQMPQLPGGGGNGAIVAAIQRATKYPPLALRNQVEGRIFVSFTVNAQGDVSDVKVVKGLGSGLDEETIRAVKTLPKFIPGKQNGRAVSVSFTVPITFKIQ